MAKKCTTCKKLTDDFPPDRRATDGLASKCRSCKRKYSRAVYKTGNPNMEVPDQLQCSKCGETKSTSEFYTDKRRLTGHQSQCKECQKEWRDSKGPAYDLWRGARERARKKGVPFTIAENDVLIPDTCPALGIPLEKGVKSLHANSPTLDRLIPERGYVPGNIAVISHRANTMKSDATVEEIQKLYKWMSSK
jgi:hypothetical protein